MRLRRKINWFQTPGQMAILIDGGFFIKRVNYLSDEKDRNNAEYMTKQICRLCKNHARRLQQTIYRVFFYDCPPFEKNVYNPLSGKCIAYKKTLQHDFKIQLFELLKNQRKFALRLGRIGWDKNNSWIIAPAKLKDLLQHKITINDLDPENDIMLNIRQKQVDLKIGIDISSMALKHLVSTIVLVAGDGDFVPASKLARREGIDFILDPLGANINSELNEHIDGLYCGLGDLLNKHAGKTAKPEEKTEDTDNGAPQTR